MESKMTEALIAQDPWNAVDLKLPPNASPALLAAAEEAARHCHREAWREVQNVDHEDPESLGWGAECRFNADQAEERFREIAKLREPLEQTQEQER